MAALTGLPTPSMDWDSSDLNSALKKFKALCELIFTGPLSEVSEEIKVKYLLIWSGEEGRELVSTWAIAADDAKKLKTYWTKFGEYVAPKSNFRLSRYKLREIKQNSSEPIDQFIKRIRLLVEECKFPDATVESQVIDAIVFGVNNDQVRRLLLKKDEKLTLTEAIEIVRIEEATRKQAHDISGASANSAKEVDAMKFKASHGKSRKPQKDSNVKKSRCENCGLFHGPDKCPAVGTTCDECGEEGHWRPVCKSRKKTTTSTASAKHKSTKSTKKKSDRKVHSLQTESEEDDGNLYFHSLHIGQLNCKTVKSEIITKLNLQSRHSVRNIKCKLDTGAQGNAMPLETYKLFHPKSKCDEFGIPVDLPKPKSRITAYGGHEIVNYGTGSLRIHFKGQTYIEIFHIVQATGPVIIGYPTCNRLNLVSVNSDLQVHSMSTSLPHSENAMKNEVANQILFKDYGDCFQGVGCFQGQFHVTLDPTVPPVVHPPRRIPEALREPLKQELCKLEKTDIIAKVDVPTDWVNSIVCATKPRGGLRLCLDPRDLNKAIKRPHHVTPTLDDILPKLNGAKYFTILDARSGYWNIMLDEESSYFTTFNTPFGRYRFKRLPFGLVCAQDVFQKKVDETFGNLDGVTGIADDIVVFGRTEEEHDRNLRAVLERARQTGLRFNPDKMIVKCSQIPFFGNILSADGLHADPSKISAIQAMEEPKDLKELQTFLGMANYLSKFTKNLSSISAPLRELCKQSSEFIWGPEHSKSFCELKKVISSPAVLKYYDNTKPLTIQVDASQRGLGAALLQQSGPIAYASKSLTETEQRYSNIEREMLGVVFGLERFHYYAYGRQVIIETDHKPLVAIHSKSLASAPPRLARMLLRIQKYDVKIIYVPGKNIGLADALSRVKPCPGNTIEGLDVSIHEMHIQLNCSATRIQALKEKTHEDPDLMALKEFIMNGWPDVRSDCPVSLHQYWNYRDELHCADGLILKNDRVVVPKAMRQEALNQIHYAHQGVEKCKLRAKGAVFWAGINKDIEEMVNACATCQKHQPSNTKEPLMPHDVPPYAWHTLGSDLFTWNQSQYLLIVDYFSKFHIIRKLNTITSKSVIVQMKGIFDEHGIPEKLISDGGTQYSSKEFKEFADNYGFTHLMSSPHYPKSNGLSERFVRTTKAILQKCLETGSDPHLAMICFRSTPVDHNIASPSELLNKRKYKSNLPTFSNFKNADVNCDLQLRQDKQKAVHDKSAKPLPSIHVNDDVRCQNPITKVWEPAKVTSVHDSPRSFVVKTGTGAQYRRNRSQLHQTKERFTFAAPSQESESSLETTVTSDQDIAEKTKPPAEPPVRRSQREIKKPERLDL